MLHIEWHNLLSSSSNAMCGEPKRISSRIDAQLVITPPPTWEGRWRQRSSPFALWTPPTRQSSHDWHMNHSTLNKSCGMLPVLVSSPISPAMLRMYSWPWTHKRLDKCCKSVQTALRLSSYPFQYPIILLEQIKGTLFFPTAIARCIKVYHKTWLHLRVLGSNPNLSAPLWYLPACISVLVVTLAQRWNGRSRMVTYAQAIREIHM